MPERNRKMLYHQREKALTIPSKLRLCVVLLQENMCSPCILYITPTLSCSDQGRILYHTTFYSLYQELENLGLNCWCYRIQLVGSKIRLYLEHVMYKCI